MHDAELFSYTTWESDKKTFQTAVTYLARLHCSCKRLFLNQLDEEKVMLQPLRKRDKSLIVLALSLILTITLSSYSAEDRRREKMSRHTHFATFQSAADKTSTLIKMESTRPDLWVRMMLTMSKNIKSWSQSIMEVCQNNKRHELIINGNHKIKTSQMYGNSFVWSYCKQWIGFLHEVKHFFFILENQNARWIPFWLL